MIKANAYKDYSETKKKYQKTVCFTKAIQFNRNTDHPKLLKRVETVDNFQRYIKDLIWEDVVKRGNNERDW